MEAPGERLVIKLWETVAEKGIGGLFRPWQMRREGRASIELKRDEMLALAQAERDAEAIRKGELVVSSPPTPGTLLMTEQSAGAIEQRVSRLEAAEAVRREVNVTRALLHAEQELQDDPQKPPEADVNEDWLFRWRDSAGQVSQEQLQNLWGRILAGEVKAPGSFSLRTLDFLKNISQDEAEAIGKLAPFVLDGRIYRGEKDALHDYGISFDFLLRMQELGIVAGVEAVGMTTTWSSQLVPKFRRPLLSASHALIATHDEAGKKLTLPTFLVTAIGMQVLSLSKSESNVPYLREIGKHFKAQGFSVTLAAYKRIDPINVQLISPEEI